MRYELEKVRYYDFDQKETLIEASLNYDYLLEKAEKLRIKEGKTFIEKVRIAELDENEEVVNYPYVRYPNE